MRFRTWLESSGLESIISGIVARHPGIKLDVYEGREKVELMSLEVPEASRGMGVGTEVVRAIQDYARSVGKPIVLRPEADRGRKGDLDRFYRGLGFVHNRGRNTDFILSSPTSRTMYWRPRVDEGVRVTDTWPVNKFMYDMKDPADRKRYEDELRDRLARLGGPPRNVVSDRIVKGPYTITCWRGFDMKSFDRDVSEEGGRMYIKGERAMEGMLWFTHSLQSPGLRPREYAVSHARGDGYLLTYPLKCVRSYRELRYDDGSRIEEIPEGHREDQTELRGSAVLDGRLYELPEGWHFTWQVQKHIGFKGRLEIDGDMLERITT